jgi:hypothetical protein
MNEYFTFKDLDTLTSHQNKPAVSIYLPTFRIPTRVQAESLQLRNLLRDAEEQLSQFDLRGPAIQAILEPARQLVSQPEFWRYQLDGLAVFLSEDSFLRYQFPVTFKPGLWVGEVYHLKPLLPLLTNEISFHILAVSQKRVRLIRCTAFAAQEIDLKTLPGGLHEILNEYELEKQVQFRNSSSAVTAGQVATSFYGGGAGESEDEKARIRQYFMRIDQALHRYLNGESRQNEGQSSENWQDLNAPLVFAGVDYLFSLYRDTNSYPNLVESNIRGNPDELPAEHLHRQAWKLMEPILVAKARSDIEQYHSSASQNLTSTHLEEVVAWADKGRVETIFVDEEAVIWGTYDSEQFQAHVQPMHTLDNRDLTELAALYTLLRKGRVYLLSPEQMEMEFGPRNRHQNNGGVSPQTETAPVVAALYRYAS